MGRHSAPEPAAGASSVVRMTPARLSRSRGAAADPVPVDLAASGAFVDDLTLITADDQLLDCIAAGQGDVFTMPQQFSSGFPAGSLAPLLATWRSEIVDPQWPSVPTAEQVRKAVRADRRPAVKHTRRALKPMLGVAVAISALLFGSAAVGAQSAKPGDVLWPLTRVLDSDRFDNYAAKDAAGNSIATAKLALSSGNPASAIDALSEARGEMEKVSLAELTQAKTSLELDYHNLMTSASVARTAAVESSAAVVAAASSALANGNGTKPGTTGVSATPPGSRAPGNGPGPSSGTAPDRSSSTGSPASADPGRPPVTGSGSTAPVTRPANPTDPAPTPTGPGTSGQSAPSSPTAPATTAPVTPYPGSTGPVTTAPGVSGPPTAASTDPVTTAASTTSALPTPTPTPPAPTPAGANAASVAPAVASQ